MRRLKESGASFRKKKSQRRKPKICEGASNFFSSSNLSSLVASMNENPEGSGEFQEDMKQEVTAFNAISWKYSNGYG